MSASDTEGVSYSETSYQTPAEEISDPIAVVHEGGSESDQNIPEQGIRNETFWHHLFGSLTFLFSIYFFVAVLFAQNAGDSALALL
jgi:hypothetical protein